MFSGVAAGGSPLLMGVLNATPDSFSDAGRWNTLQERVERAHQIIQDGADILDIGGESAVTDKPAVSAGEEIERVIPLVEEISKTTDVMISVDTYKPEVAEAAITAGARIINDISGLANPVIAKICACGGAALVVMHNRGRPKQRLVNPNLYSQGVVEDVMTFWDEKIAVASKHGLSVEKIILDPGPDFSKTPAQTIEIFRDVKRLALKSHSLLFAISRKDFIGALTQRLPAERLAGTLAVLSYLVNQTSHQAIFRLHDIAPAKDFLKVYETLAGDTRVDKGLQLDYTLRYSR